MPFPHRTRTAPRPLGLLLAPALALLLPLAAPVPAAEGRQAAAAARDPGNCDRRRPTVDWLRCLQQAVGQHDPGRGQPTVVVQQRFDWVGDAAQLSPRFLEEAQQAFQRGGLVVQVHRTPAGEAGTMVMLLSPNLQVSRRSEMTRMRPEVFDPVRRSRVCEAQRRPLCDGAAPAPAGQQAGPVTGEALIGQRVAAEFPAPKSPPGKRTPTGAEPEDEGGGPSWPLFFAAAFLLLAGGVLFVRRAARPVAAPSAPGTHGRRDTPARTPSHAPPPASPRTPPPSPPPGPPRYGRPSPSPPPPPPAAPHRSHHADVPPGPRTSALVRTELRPQGYVEFGRCLRRAAWVDPAVPPPPPGEAVDVVPGRGVDEGLLLALPAAPADRTAPDATRYEEPS